MSDPELPLEEDEVFTVRGELETTSVPDLLKSLVSSRETAILTCRNGDEAKSIYIHNGRVVYAASNNKDERLGEVLLIQGRITARQFLEASKLIRPGSRLGAILVELSAIEPDELIPSVEHHVREIMHELFTWTRGDYELVIKDLDPDSVVTLNIGTEALILEGIRRTRSWSLVIKAIGDIDAVFSRTGHTDSLYKLDLTTEEQEVLAQVNGRSTVEQICEVSYLSNFETCRVLWAFLVLGLIRRPQTGESEAAGEGIRARERELDLEEIVEKFNQMFNRIHGFLKGRMGDGVNEFMDHCLEEVSRQYGALFDGVDLKEYGRADFEQMLANVADLPAPQRKSLMISALNELVYAIQLSVRTRHGAQEAAVVSGIIKDGFRRIGAA